MTSTELIQLLSNAGKLLFRALDPDSLVKGIPGVINIIPEGNPQWQMTIFSQGIKLGFSGIQEQDGKLTIKDILCTNRKDIILQRTVEKGNTIRETLSPLDTLPEILKKCLDTTKKREDYPTFTKLKDIFVAGKELITPKVECPEEMWQKFGRLSLYWTQNQTTIQLVSKCKSGRILIRADVTELGTEDISVRLNAEINSFSYTINCTNKDGKPSVPAALEMDGIISSSPGQKKISLAKPKPTAK